MNTWQSLFLLGILTGLGMLVARRMSEWQASNHETRVRQDARLAEAEVARIADLLFAEIAKRVGSPYMAVDCQVSLKSLNMSQVDKRRIVKSLVDAGRLVIVDHAGKVWPLGQNWSQSLMPRYLRPTEKGWAEIVAIQQRPYLRAAQKIKVKKIDSHNVGPGATSIKAGKKAKIKMGSIKSGSKSAQAKELLEAMLAALLRDAESLPDDQRRDAQRLIGEIQADLPDEPDEHTAIATATKVTQWAKLAGAVINEASGFIDQIQKWVG